MWSAGNAQFRALATRSMASSRFHTPRCIQHVPILENKLTCFFLNFSGKGVQLLLEYSSLLRKQGALQKMYTDVKNSFTVVE